MTGYSSADAWAKALDNPLAKAALLKLLKQAAKFIDKKCELPAQLNLETYISKHEKEWLGL